MTNKKEEEDPKKKVTEAVHYVKQKIEEKPYYALAIGFGVGLLTGAAIGSITTKSGIDHSANVPTEEVFTTPHYKKTEGYVTSTKPLNYAGSLIEEFRFEFSEGKIVKATANRGEDDLQNLINIDEWASYLGEVALVPNSSPISQLGTLFYNSLIDENASCHIAFGRGIRVSIKN